LDRRSKRLMPRACVEGLGRWLVDGVFMSNPHDSLLLGSLCQGFGVAEPTCGGTLEGNRSEGAAAVGDGRDRPVARGAFTKGDLSGEAVLPEHGDVDVEVARQ